MPLLLQVPLQLLLDGPHRRGAAVEVAVDAGLRGDDAAALRGLGPVKRGLQRLKERGDEGEAEAWGAREQGGR